MIKNHLSRLLGERKMKQSELARKARIRPSTIGAMYSENAQSIAFDHLEAICRVLDCNISDLLEIVPNEPHPKINNH